MDVLHSAHFPAVGPVSRRRSPDGALLHELDTARADLPGEVVTTTSNRAHGIDHGLAAGPEVALMRVALPARDRLDVLRRRANTAGQPIGDSHLLVPDGRHANRVRRGGLLCTYCRHPLTADSFEYLSRMRRLVCASCPICERRTTVRASTWVRLNKPGLPERPGTRP